MNILFVHGNFPGQFGSLAGLLARRGHQVISIGGPQARGLPQIPLHRYQPKRGSTPAIHRFAVRYEADCLRGEAVAATALQLAGTGFRPDVIVGHVGWGEPMFLKDIWPDAKMAVYAEFYYRGRGGDVGFDPEFANQDLAETMRVRAKSGAMSIMVAESDLAIAPTEWQRATYPEALRARITTVHDGIDTSEVKPRPGAQFQLPDGGRLLRVGDEVVTYVNRHLEPMRGIHIFLRALPEILKARPTAEVLLIGQAGNQPYGAPPPKGRTWKDIFLDEVKDRIDPSRVHWLGRVDRAAYLQALAVSKVHAYLTYPFVLSWSLLEAMSAECLVVASATPPVQEVIEHGKNGLLVDFFDHGALARTIVDALARPSGDFAVIKASARDTIITRYDRDLICLPQLVGLIEGWA